MAASFPEESAPDPVNFVYEEGCGAGKRSGTQTI